MKLFISYSREDAGDFAKHIHRYLRNNGHDVFIDVNSIRIGDPWAGSIEKNISDCDIFVVILTPDSLKSGHVEREVLQAQREKKTIVPCISEDVEYSEIKWDLEKVQGIEFTDEFKLARRLYSRIKSYDNYISTAKGIDDISVSTSKDEYDSESILSPSKENDDKFLQEKDSIQRPKERPETIPSKTIEKIGTATTKPPTSDSSISKEMKDLPQPPKVKMNEVKPAIPSEEEITASTPKKEEKEKIKSKEKDSSNKRQGIFGSYSKTEEPKTNVPTTPIKADTEEIQQKEDTLPPSNVNTGPIGGISGGMSSSPKYTPESENYKIKYTERDSSRQSKGINLKLIFIPIIAVAVIALIVAASYFNTTPPAPTTVTPPDTLETVTPPNTLETVTPPDTLETVTPYDTSETINLVNSTETITPPDTTETITPVNMTETITPPDTTETITPVNMTETITPVNMTETITPVNLTEILNETGGTSERINPFNFNFAPLYE